MPGSTVVLIGASMAALLGVSLSTPSSCAPTGAKRTARRRHSHGVLLRSVIHLELGLGRPCGIDEAVLAAYPTMVYSSVASRRGEGQMAAAVTTSVEGGKAPEDTRDATCAVCLAEYADGDELRWLPGCRHAFHRPCLDEWLLRRPSCPLCRTSPPAATDS